MSARAAPEFDMETKQEIRRAYESGALLHELRARYHTRLATIRQAIVDAGGQLGRRSGRPRALTDAQAVEVAERIVRGEKINDLAAEFGVSRPTIRLYNKVGRELIVARERAGEGSSS